MTLIVPLPASLRAKLAQNTHPGLMLDKYVKSWDEKAEPGKFSERVQKPALEDVVRLSHRPPEHLEFEELLRRRRRILDGLSSHSFRCTTSGPLTLHLARASALENAGICLHPLYGFTCLPGTGLKGMARAYAETVWKPRQSDAKSADAKIESVFGNRPGESKPERQRAGSVVFHDAWPTAWPQLVVDILNNHHAKYYSGKDAPGDWENPVPVYFLAVPRGTTFEFAISARTAEPEAALIEQARDWLLGALCHLGAGAKTNSGYGSFAPIDAPRPELNWPSHAVYEAKLELITPGFLAGADQFEPAGCDLRPATLRGLLRWWWRTLHAGFLDNDALRSLEAALWGNSRVGGAVRLEIVPEQYVGPDKFAFKDHFEPRPEFKRQHGLATPRDRKTTQGLFYVSYGMDETGRDKQPRQRWFLDAGSRWTLRLVARAAVFPTVSAANEKRGQRPPPQQQAISAGDVLLQARAALWLLCTYGAAGSKSRKGFGSLQLAQASAGDGFELPECSSVADLRLLAATFRSNLGLRNTCLARDVSSSALGDPTHLPDVVEVEVPWDDPWKVMDEIGFAYQAFAQDKKHDPAKAALGLPRKIHGPNDRKPLGHQPNWQPSRWLESSRSDQRSNRQNARYASPVHIHVARNDSGRLVVRALAFPAADLPDLNGSRAFLREFLQAFAANLKERAAQWVPDRNASRSTAQARGYSPGQASSAPAPAVSIPQITPEQIVQKLGELPLPLAMFKLQKASSPGTYAAQRLRPEPKVKSGFQPEGNRKVVSAPPGLAEGVYVIAEQQGNEGRFVEVFGRLPPAEPPRGFRKQGRR